MKPGSLPVVLAGLGRIAHAEHLPAISARDDLVLAATVDPSARVRGVRACRTLTEALAHVPPPSAVVLCTPPAVRFQLAREALLGGHHVLLEKPPAAALSQVDQLEQLARERGVTLLASWHSRHAPAVEPARRWLADKRMRCASIVWKEDVRRWHPGQDWLFEPGGMGVFDPGMNAFSIATRILPAPFTLSAGTLLYPANRQAPIAAALSFADPDGAPIEAQLDFRQTGNEIWDLTVVTDQGRLNLSRGGRCLCIDEAPIDVGDAGEYAGVYAHFLALIRTGSVDVDSRPLRHVADAFMLAAREQGKAFRW